MLVRPVYACNSEAQMHYSDGVNVGDRFFKLHHSFPSDVFLGLLLAE